MNPRKKTLQQIKRTIRASNTLMTKKAISQHVGTAWPYLSVALDALTATGEIKRVKTSAGFVYGPGEDYDRS